MVLHRSWPSASDLGDPARTWWPGSLPELWTSWEVVDMAVAEQAAVGHSNEVHLVGRLAAPPVSRDLPSGDLVVTFRLVVARERPRRGSAARSATVDTIDCAAWTKAAQRSVRSWDPGDVVEVRGALRRRFWRSPHGPSSRSEVEVTSARRATRATAG